MSTLTCQRDAYRRTALARVLDVIEHTEGVEVRLSETLLYPEGGGQPDDHGTIDEAPVRALRKGTDGAVWHRLDRPPRGAEAVVTVDWARRFDHMQQHTAQHLISAIAADQLGAETVAFHLRPDVCDIDMGRVLTPAEVVDLEGRVNDAIRADRPVRARLATPAELDGVRSRGLPANFQGSVRLVEIEGLDSNTCGGTHVSRLGALQAVSLLPPQKNKGGSKLRYLAGGRVVAYLRAVYDREHALSKLLSSGPPAHADAVRRLQQGTKDSGRAQKALMVELAGLQGHALAQQPQPHLHRADADMGFLRAAASAAVDAAPSRIFLLTGGGMFMLAGPAGPVAELGPKVAALLGGRGGGAHGRFQGRAASLDQLGAVLGLLVD